MATWLEHIESALSNLGGVAPLDDIYRETKRLRASPMPSSYKTIVRRIILDHSSDSEGFRGPDLFYSVEGIGSGVWGLRSSLKSTPAASDIQDPKLPGRVLVQTYRVLRDTELARKLKALHKGACQICGQSLTLRNGDIYSEAHHVQPLGAPHNGPDTADNIVVLCPNHHVLLDYGAVPLTTAKLRTLQGHVLGGRYVQYHNEVICSGERKMRSNPAPQRTPKSGRR